MKDIDIKGVISDDRFRVLVEMLVKTVRRLSQDDREEFLKCMEEDPGFLSNLQQGESRQQLVYQLLLLMRVIIRSDLDDDNLDLWTLVEKELLHRHTDTYLSLNVRPMDET